VSDISHRKQAVRTIGAIDVGSNTVRGLAARLDGCGNVRAYCDDFRMTALGRSLSTTGRMADAAIVQTAEFVAEFIERCGRLDEIHCVGTAAVREAENASELQQALRKRAGVTVEAISAEEEGRLSYRGAVALRPDLASRGPLVADVGGRSTEMARETSSRLCSVTVPVGARLLTEDYLQADPPTSEQLARAREAAAAALHDSRAFLQQSGTLLAAGGTACSAALMLDDRWDLERPALTELLERLCGLPLAQRRRLLALDPPRAEVICGGLVALEALAAAAAADCVHVSLGGIREGLLLERAGGRRIIAGT
jgi:exopolyphosphatase/guanosine-5'-triphosphate,3'-diphosphate pyrophosphatase